MMVMQAILSLLIVLLFVCSTSAEPARPSVDQVRDLIADTFLELPEVFLNEEEQNQLLEFVREFKRAREEIDQQIDIWGYVNEDAFQEAFENALSLLMEGLRRQNHIQQPKDSDLKLMLQGYQKNAETFEILLEELEKRRISYPLLPRNPHQIVQRQIQFSAFVMATDLDSWRNMILVYSVIFPMSSSQWAVPVRSAGIPSAVSVNIQLIGAWTP